MGFFGPEIPPETLLREVYEQDDPDRQKAMPFLTHLTRFHLYSILREHYPDLFFSFDIFDAMIQGIHSN